MHAPPSVSAGPGIAPTPPRTFGETAAIRLGRANLLEKLIYAAVAITLIVAGCSLAVAAGGGLVDRKRPGKPEPGNAGGATARKGHRATGRRRRRLPGTTGDRRPCPCAVG